MGAPAKAIRLMVGLHYLKHTSKESDESLLDRWVENPYWLRRFRLSLLKQHSGKQCLVMKRRMCGWKDNFLLQVLNIPTT